ncbi:MAG TPA: hypothetical protein VFS21_17520 [Roseiflexaceae bacterium]|nr:hypothetical protein [Roseiflexaceae bacterium]
MPEALPGALLVAMIVLTLVLLPRLQDEGGSSPADPSRPPEELPPRKKRHPRKPSAKGR